MRQRQLWQNCMPAPWQNERQILHAHHNRGQPHKLPRWMRHSNSQPPHRKTPSRQCHIYSQREIHDAWPQRLLPDDTHGMLWVFPNEVGIVSPRRYQPLGLKQQSGYQWKCPLPSLPWNIRLPQAGIITQELLEQYLLKAGYTQSKITPGYWKHKWRPISFHISGHQLWCKVEWKGARPTPHQNTEGKLWSRGRRLGRYKILGSC